MLEIKCPKCRCPYSVKDGRTLAGTQRYRCWEKSCRYRFTAKPRVNSGKKNADYCREYRERHGLLKRGRQPISMPCPFCGCPIAFRDGWVRGRQRYRCWEGPPRSDRCGRRFTEATNPNRGKATEEQRRRRNAERQRRYRERKKATPVEKGG